MSVEIEGGPQGSLGLHAVVPAGRIWEDFDPAIAPAAGRRASWQQNYLRGVISLDLVAAALAGITGFALRLGHPASPTRPQYLAFAAGLPLVWCSLLAANRAYEGRFLYFGSDETRRVFRSGLMLIAGVSFAAYAFRFNFSRGYMLGSLPGLVAGTAACRYSLRRSLHRRRAEGACTERTIIVGHPGPAAQMIARLRRQTYHGLDVVAICVPPGAEPKRNVLDAAGVPVYSGAGHVIAAVTDLDADVVVVLSSPEMDGGELRRLSWKLEATGAQLLVAPALIDVTGPRTCVRLASGLPLLHMEPPEFSGFRRLAKSVLDRIAAAFALLLVSPLLALIFASIRLQDGAPAIFRQTRVGCQGREFTLLKFRTMHPDAERRLESLHERNESDGVLFKMRSDPRITTVGRHLRRFSLDELPQLINVVRGDMSLVGPRPPLPAEVSKYETDFRRRLVVPPGMTGLWQVSGRANLSWEESMYVDLHYVENWSPALDLLILLKTVRAVVRADGAY